MNSTLVSKSAQIAKAAVVAAAAAALVIASGATGSTPSFAGSASCGDLSLVNTLSGLRSSATLDVQHTRTQVTVIDKATKTPLFVAACHGVLKHGVSTQSERPAPSKSARTFVRRGADGTVVYTHSVTARGARATVIGAGHLMRAALHVTTFDNDDLHITDAKGALVHSVTSKGDGTLVEREGTGYGCGCERVTHPDGRTVRRPLP